MSEKKLAENTIAFAAANVLRRSFIEASSNETVLYVEGDKVMQKSPNGKPVVVKLLTRSNSNLARKAISRGTLKLKKRNSEPSAE